MARGELRFRRIAERCRCDHCEQLLPGDRLTARYTAYDAGSRELTAREVAWLIGHILGSLRGREEW